MAKKKWSDLTVLQKRAVYVGGAAESVITVAAVRDLAKRPAGDVRGPKAVWVLAFFVQPFGPIAYFAAARR
ncbi:MAG: PLDc N-terminal domain-containing protein [Actinomycetota bacterium]|nr:PLDc N-terminal domain-containing protein [Actinomycetota bacterium]